MEFIPPLFGGSFTPEELDFIPPKGEVPLYGMPKSGTRRTGIPPQGEAPRAGNYDIKWRKTPWRQRRSYQMGKELEGEE